jgi:hypothetical protein
MSTLTINTLFGDITVTLTGNGGGHLQSTLQRDQDHDPDEALDAIEGLVLAHACAGVDITSPAYVEGVNTTLETIDNDS